MWSPRPCGAGDNGAMRGRASRPVRGQRPLLQSEDPYRNVSSSSVIGIAGRSTLPGATSACCRSGNQPNQAAATRSKPSRALRHWPLPGHTRLDHAEVPDRCCRTEGKLGRQLRRSRNRLTRISLDPALQLPCNPGAVSTQRRSRPTTHARSRGNRTLNRTREPNASTSSSSSACSCMRSCEGRQCNRQRGLFSLAVPPGKIPRPPHHPEDLSPRPCS